MTAVREAIFAEIERRLRQIDGVTEVERMPSGDPMTFNALHIFDDGHEPAEPKAMATRYRLAPEIVDYVEGEGGAEAHARLHELYTAVVEVLITEPPLDGLAETIDEGAMRIEVAPLASKRSLAFSLSIPITFPTRRGAPAQSA